MNKPFHKICTFTAYLSMVVSTLTLVGCATTIPSPSYASYFDRLPCVDRIGRCFDATIGGQPVIVIEDKLTYERMNADAKRSNTKLREFYWMVAKPVDQKMVFDVIVKSNAFGLAHVGELAQEPELTVFPLDDQDVSTKEELVANAHVRINSQPVVTAQNTITQNYLPPGRYVLVIRYVGVENWDQKRVYLTVK